jgi:hypothetical protein
MAEDGFNAEIHPQTPGYLGLGADLQVGIIDRPVHSIPAHTRIVMYGKAITRVAGGFAGSARYRPGSGTGSRRSGSSTASRGLGHHPGPAPGQADWWSRGPGQGGDIRRSSSHGRPQGAELGVVDRGDGRSENRRGHVPADRRWPASVHRPVLRRNPATYDGPRTTMSRTSATCARGTPTSGPCTCPR